MNNTWIRIRTFHEPFIAQVYLSELEEQNIRFVTQNENISSIMPVSHDLSARIHVLIREKDLSKSREIFMILDERSTKDMDEDFRDADLADIQYQKELHSFPNFRHENTFLFQKEIWIILLTILIFSLLLYFK